MTHKYTPGQWKAEGWENVTINAHDPSHPQGFVTIVACPGGSDQTTLAEMQANAALIAAAPDLLAALEELLWSASGTSLETDSDYSNAFTAAREAISKATKGQ